MSIEHHTALEHFGVATETGLPEIVSQDDHGVGALTILLRGKSPAADGRNAQHFENFEETLSPVTRSGRPLPVRFMGARSYDARAEKEPVCVP